MLLWLVVCIGSALYWVHIVSVVIHEVIGHGLVATLLGGEFHGFMISHGAFGWAYAYIPSDVEGYIWKESLVLAGGSVSTLFAGLLTVTLLSRVRRLPVLARLTGVLLAYALLTEGATYLLFTSVVPTGGDWAEILRLWGNPFWLRAIFITCGLVLVLVSVRWCLNHGLRYWAAILHTRGIEQRVWVAVPGVLVMLPSFTFDWDQLAPGLWQWPNLTMLVVHLVLSFVLVRSGDVMVTEEIEGAASPLRWKTFGVTNAVISLALFACCWFVLRHEVTWGL